MTHYADLDVSVLDELPPGRTPIRTRLVSDVRRDEVVARVRAACLDGRQAYWVCPLIEESEALQLQTAQDTFVTLVEALPELRVGLVHGRLKNDEKSATMAAFSSGELDLLVATTVIEVGVDVPNASRGSVTVWSKSKPTAPRRTPCAQDHDQWGRAVIQQRRHQQTATVRAAAARANFPAAARPPMASGTRNSAAASPRSTPLSSSAGSEMPCAGCRRGQPEAIGVSRRVPAMGSTGRVESRFRSGDRLLAMVLS